jgi:SNF2 family DNA or RNA helicase
VIQLRPYQHEGVDRILDRRNLLLAMVMGSGKTVTSAAAVRKLRRLREVDCGAVFALKSTKYQWVREIAKVDPNAKVQVIEGDKRRRVAGYRRALRYQYTILHYECLIHDWDEIKQYLPTDFLILDEISAIKGFKAKRSKRAKILGKRCDVRLGLSGQPVENRPEELFSIMEFIDPDVLGPFTRFDRTFIVRDHWGRPTRYRNLHLIQNRLGPAMYRKSRDDIAQWLPDLIPVEMPVVLDEVTMRLHDIVRADLSEAIDKALNAGASGYFDVEAHYGRADYQDHTLMGQVMSRLLAMRMLSSHPRLLRVSADDFDNPLTKKGSTYASEMKEAGLLDNLPLSSAKLDALLETVNDILDEDPLHKVVIFSYFKPMLKMIGTHFTKTKRPYTTITGDITSAKERFTRIERFNTDPKCRLFLSSDAGAYGVDLHAGSHLINYDLPWSAGALAQRSARIDRTASGFAQIRIIYMFGHQTIEERMYDQLQQKAKVARAFIDGDFDARSGSLKLDLESLREFLDAA